MVCGRRSGGEPLWIVCKRPHELFLGVWMSANFVKQAAPGNVSTRVRSLSTSSGRISPHGTMGETSRAVIRGSRLFNSLFGLPRN